MASPALTAEAHRIAAAGAVTAEDVVALRRIVYHDAEASLDEAEALLRLDESLTIRSREWTDFLAEAVTDLLVRQEEPRDHVSPEKARWLIERISADGVIASESELDVLVHVIEAAESAPHELSAFALKQIAKAVVDGEGPLARGGRLTRGLIGAAEVALLKRILYALAGDGGLAISHAEAEVLFELAAATGESANDPSWGLLFAQAIASSVMAAAPMAAPSREEAAAQESWLADTTIYPGRLLRRVLTEGFGKLARPGEVLRTANPWAARNARVATETAIAEVITEEEAGWLMAKLKRLRPSSLASAALCDFLARERPAMPEALARIVEDGRSRVA